MYPVKLRVVKNQFLAIKWDDGSETEISLNKLRGKCPCANCNAEREERSKTYIPLYTGDQLKILKLNIVGHYAIGISWKDGHNTGIYEFDYIRSIGNIPEKRK